MSNQRVVCARAARNEFADAFEQGIRCFRDCRVHSVLLSRLAFLPNQLVAEKICGSLLEPEVAQMAFEGVVDRPNSVPKCTQNNFLVMARPRPMPCAACVTSEVSNNAIVSHDGRVHRDGRTLYLVHSRFHLDRVFGAQHGNNSVFDACTPLVEHSENGNRATLLFFGQTGTGKTHTTFGVQEELGKHLDGTEFSIKIYELAGDGGKEQGFDLLRQREKVKILEGEDGFVHVRGAEVIHCSSKQDLDVALNEARQYRFSLETERNAQSSRSHCVFEIGFPSGGMLRLVDLAGSERNAETTQHSKQMATHGINSSLLALKECGRIMYEKANGKPHLHVPFRSSKLTHVLRDCFIDETHKTIVVGTLSPLADDVEHTLNTLQHLITLRGGSDRKKTHQVTSFNTIGGRGKHLHSKLQDNDQRQLHAFNMFGPVGGGIMKKYDPDNLKYESFIDARWHPELKARVDDDLWVYQEADKEVIHQLTHWRQQQYEERKNHSVSTWSCERVQEFLKEVLGGVPAEIPTQMDGRMLDRLGETRLKSVLGEDGRILQEALLAERKRYSEIQRSQSDRNAKINALSKNQVVKTLRESDKENAETGTA